MGWGLPEAAGSITPGLQPYSHAHTSPVAASSVTALMAPGSREVPTHSDAPSRGQALLPPCPPCISESNLNRLLQTTGAWEAVLPAYGDDILRIMIMAIPILCL